MASWLLMRLPSSRATTLQIVVMLRPCLHICPAVCRCLEQSGPDSTRGCAGPDNMGTAPFEHKHFQPMTRTSQIVVVLASLPICPACLLGTPEVSSMMYECTRPCLVPSFPPAGAAT